MHTTMSSEELDAALDTAKDLVLISMVVEGLVTKDQADEFALTHAIVTFRKGWLRRIFDGKHKDRMSLADGRSMHCVKVLGDTKDQGGS